LKEQESLNKDH